MIRILIGVVLCVCAIYVGYGLRKYYRTRVALYKELIAFIERLIQEISFLKPPLMKIVQEYASGKSEWSKILQVFAQESMKSGAINAQQLRQNIRCLYLTHQEKDLVVGLLSELGTLDSVTQLRNLEGYKSRFDKINMECQEKLKTVGALAFKLGVLGGILAMIMVA